MRRLIAALIVVSIASAAPAAEEDRCLGVVDLTGLPLIELRATNPGPIFAVMLSGDGGWRRIDRKVTDKLRAAGIPIVGFLSSSYFRKRRTPEESACALERVIRAYELRWNKSEVILIGYSRGADVMPFMVSRLPEDLRATVKLIALLGLEPMIDFKYDPPWTLAYYFGHEPQVPVLPELEKLRGDHVVCVYGAKEKDSLCPHLDPSRFQIVQQPGGHHFAGRYQDVADVILDATH